MSDAAERSGAGPSWPRTAGLSALVLLTTLGEGGGSPPALLAWHGALLALLLLRLAAPPREPAGRLPAALVTCLAAFSILALLGALRAPYGYAAWLTLLELAACAGLGWLAVGAGPGLLRDLVWPLGLGVGAHGTLALVQALAGGSRPASTFLNPNHLAAWLGAGALLVLGAGLEGRRPAARRALAVLGAIGLAGVLATGSRGALLGLAAGGGWLVAARWSRTASAVRTGIVATVALVAALAGWRQLDRLGDTDPFRYQRVRIWAASAAVVADSPWWGAGPGQFATSAANLQFPDGDGPLRYDRRFSIPHSDILRAAAEFGLPAAAALAAALLLGAGSVRVRRRAGSLPRGADGAIAALLALAAQAAVDDPSTWPSVYALASVLAGALLRIPSAARAPGRLVRAASAAALVLVFAVGDLGPYLAWRAARGLPRGRLPPAGLARLEQAERRNPMQPDYAARLAEHLAAAAPAWDLATYVAARASAERAVRLHPASADTRRTLARVEALACRSLFPSTACREHARRLYLAAQERARTDAGIAVELAAFLIDTGDPRGARRAAERALELEPEAALPRLLLADALLASVPPAVEAARRLVAEARARAERWSTGADGAQPAGLLRADALAVQRLESALRAADEAPARSPAAR